MGIHLDIRTEVQLDRQAEVKDQGHKNLRNRFHSMQSDFWVNVLRKFQNLKNHD